MFPNPHRHSTTPSPPPAVRVGGQPAAAVPQRIAKRLRPDDDADAADTFGNVAEVVKRMRESQVVAALIPNLGSPMDSIDTALTKVLQLVSVGIMGVSLQPMSQRMHPNTQATYLRHMFERYSKIDFFGRSIL